MKAVHTYRLVIGCVSPDSFLRQRGNDMETFSWFDSLRALAAPCIDCLQSPKNERNDLEDLLADSGSASATTADAETLSLHSNPGSPRRKRARFTKNIRLFGWDLFGRQPIRLPDDDEEDEEENDEGGGGDGDGEEEQRRRRKKKKRRSHHGSYRRPPPVTISSSTLDSDAAPLDSAAIASHATNYAEEEAKRAERRRERRRQRREMKRAAALEQAAMLADGDEFEGFQGSGIGSPHSPPPPLGHDGGTRARAAQELVYTPNEEDEEDGDFDADAYTRRTSGSSDSGRGSDSRSRTSTTTTSVSGQYPTAKLHPHSGHSIQPYNHHYISQQPTAHPAATADAPLLPVRRTKNKSSRSSASKSSSSSASSSKRSHSLPSSPLSPSLASPVASTAPLSTTTTTNITPSMEPPSAAPQETSEGFTNRGPRLQTVGIERQSTSGFPSPGIGGPRNGKRDMGAFLANRGV